MRAPAAVTSPLGGSAGIYVYDGSDCAKAQEVVRLFNSRKNQDGSASAGVVSVRHEQQGQTMITAAPLHAGYGMLAAPPEDSGADPQLSGTLDSLKRTWRRQISVRRSGEDC